MKQLNWTNDVRFNKLRVGDECVPRYYRDPIKGTLYQNALCKVTDIRGTDSNHPGVRVTLEVIEDDGQGIVGQTIEVYGSEVIR